MQINLSNFSSNIFLAALGKTFARREPGGEREVKEEKLTKRSNKEEEKSLRVEKEKSIFTPAQSYFGGEILMIKLF